jgi:hypothetical protein
MRPSLRGFLLAGLLVAAGLALFVSGFAAGSPDGLERVAEDKGFLETARDHRLANGPLADYGVKGVDKQRLSTGLSGLIGVLVTFGIGLALFTLVRRGRSTPATGAVDSGRRSAPGAVDRGDHPTPPSATLPHRGAPPPESGSSVPPRAP